MPYLPSHMGIGLLAKAVKPEKFSLAMFGLTQIVIDIQPLLNRINPDLMPRHTPSHSILGAIVVVILCMPLRQALSIMVKVPITYIAALYGALVGVSSHLLLDAIDHADVSRHLFWPLKLNSHLFYLVNNFHLVLICLLVGSLGILRLLQRGLISSYLKRWKAS